MVAVNMVVMVGIEPTPFFLMREAYRPSILHHLECTYKYSHVKN